MKERFYGKVSLARGTVWKVNCKKIKASKLDAASAAGKIESSRNNFKYLIY